MLETRSICIAILYFLRARILRSFQELLRISQLTEHILVLFRRFCLLDLLILHRRLQMTRNYLTVVVRLISHRLQLEIATQEIFQVHPIPQLDAISEKINPYMGLEQIQYLLFLVFLPEYQVHW